jgi:hypothetical protein
MMPTMRKHLFLAIIGLLHAVAVLALAFAASAWVLDRYTSDTAFGTFAQIAPFAAMAIAFFAYPVLLVRKKRAADAAIVLVSAFAFAAVLSYTVFGLVTCRYGGCGSDVDVLDPCLSGTRDALSEEEKLACPNWCPYKGPLLGGNYWAKDGEQCVYL